MVLFLHVANSLVALWVDVHKIEVLYFYNYLKLLYWLLVQQLVLK